MAALFDRYRVTQEPLRSERRAELALLLAVLLLLALLLYQGLRLVSLSAPEPVLPVPGSLQAREVDLEQGLTDDESRAIRSRPLFWSSRRPLEPRAEEPEPEPAEQQESGNIDKVKLLGVFGVGDSAGIIALVKGQRQRIAVGETVEGWKLIAVKLDSAIFARAGKRRQIELERSSVPAGARR